MVRGSNVSDGESLQPGGWRLLLSGSMCISWAGVTASFLSQARGIFSYYVFTYFLRLIFCLFSFWAPIMLILVP